MLIRILALLYGLSAFAAGTLISTYQIAFVGGFLVPKTVDRGGESESMLTAFLMDSGLLILFGLQHSLMARPGFKRWWQRVVPEPFERATYVWLVFLAYALLFWQWQPIDYVLWEIHQPVLVALLWFAFAVGWGLVLWSSYLINPWDMWGFRQAWAYYQGNPYKLLNIQVSGPYRSVRHPIMLGLFVAFWAAPVMTAGHALFAALMTAYGLIGTVFEERDLIRNFPDYEQYRHSTPSIFPRWGGPKR